MRGYLSRAALSVPERRMARFAFRGRGVLPWAATGRRLIGEENPYETHARQARHYSSCLGHPFRRCPGPPRRRPAWGRPAGEWLAQRPDGSGYLIKPRDIGADVRGPRRHWLQRQLLAAERAGQHTVHRGGSPATRPTGQRSANGETGPAARHAGAGSAACQLSAADAAAGPQPLPPLPSVSCQPLGRGL